MLGFDNKPFFMLVGAGLVLGAVAYTVRSTRPVARPLRGPSMVKAIAAESRSPEEYARRIEAWNSSEAKPLSITLLAKAYRGAPAPVTARLIREAREARIEGRERLWSRMSKGLRGAQRGRSSAYRLENGRWMWRVDYADGSVRYAEDSYATKREALEAVKERSR